MKLSLLAGRFEGLHKDAVHVDVIALAILTDMRLPLVVREKLVSGLLVRGSVIEESSLGRIMRMKRSLRIVEFIRDLATVACSCKRKS